MVTRPARPNKYTFTYLTLFLCHLVFSLSFLSYSEFLPPSLSAFSLSFIGTGSRQLLHRHGQAFSSQFSLSAFAWQRTRRHGWLSSQYSLSAFAWRRTRRHGWLQINSLSRRLLGKELAVTGGSRSVLSLGVCLTKNSPSRVAPDQVRPHWIW